MASFQSHLPMFVLDVLRHDEIENLSSILNMLNDKDNVGWRMWWPTDFKEDEVTAIIEKLVLNGDVEACHQESPNGAVVPANPKEFISRTNVNDWWFHLTSKGYDKWQHWLPPGEDGT